MAYIPCAKKAANRQAISFSEPGKNINLSLPRCDEKKWDIPPWTQVPIDTFERQIKYLSQSQRYNIISLKRAIESIKSGKHLPRNPAVITFDDGYRNNYTLALPILQKYRTRATIFITAGYIGSTEILPVEEAYVILTRSKNGDPCTIPGIGIGTLFFETSKNLLNSYQKVVSRLKRFPTKGQKEYLGILRQVLGSKHHKTDTDLVEDFRLLSWDEIRSLMETNLIEIGAHTVSHEILTNLPPKEAAQQIIDSKSIIQANLDCDTDLFSYPNGTEADYNHVHIKCLKDNGFICSVTITPRLNKARDNPYRLGRMCIGHDFSANPNHFALNVSGFLSVLKSLGDHTNA